MNIEDMIFLSLRHMRMGKIRAVLNMLGFIIGTASIIAVLCVADGGKIAIDNKLDKMGMNCIAIKTSGASVIDYSDYEYLKTAMKNGGFSDEITPVYMNYADVICDGKRREIVVWGVAEGFENVYDVSLSQGRYFNKFDLEKNKNVLVAESVMAESVFPGLEIGDSVEIEATGKKIQAKIIGITDDGDESLKNSFADAVPVFVYMPVKSAMQLFDTDHIDYISVKNSQADYAAKKSVSLLQRRGGTGYYAENMSAQRSGIDTIIALISLILGAIAAISLVVSILGVVNIMLMTVNERTGEIGVLKAVGAKNRDIMMQFLSETVIIVSIGAVVGCVLGYFTGKIAAMVIGIPFVFNWKTSAAVSVILVAAGAIFGVYPAKIAANIDPAKILK